MIRIVIDTNIFLAAVLQPEKTCRSLLRLVLKGKFQALIGEALFHEYEDILARDALFIKCPISTRERDDLFDAFLTCSEWVNIYYRWAQIYEMRLTTIWSNWLLPVKRSLSSPETSGI